MGRTKKILLISGIAIVAFIGLVILFASPIAKHLIEKYDEKYTGREIKMDWAYVNVFTGQVYFNDIKIYELKSDSIFFSANTIGINVSMLKLFSKEYEITELSLDHPKGTIIQTGTKHDFNFNL